MKWSLDIFRAQTTKLWPFEATGALRTVAAAKALWESGGLPKQKYVLKVPKRGNIGGLPKSLENTIGEGGLPPHSQVSQCDSRKSRSGVACIWDLAMGTSTPKGASMEAGLPRKAKVFQEWPWMSREWPWMTRKWP